MIKKIILINWVQVIDKIHITLRTYLRPPFFKYLDLQDQLLTFIGNYRSSQNRYLHWNPIHNSFDIRVVRIPGRVNTL